ncbi:hypothetical protein ATO11_08690 [Pseudaestuariivita atlantica]|uniref:Serine aminopeptidase S33 domain-containing protein n=1 Tax=Pseudaestuariivita atlantica TaxID=1317121 RepID=A0A0L1JRQ8_9RHOB|nr:hypothetical protein ATO11_08690 [Pseudaestuariivita atlantica]
MRSGEAVLAGTLFVPRGAPRAIVVMNSATGVPQRYYRAFATWLAEDKGVAVLTYDYRDFGDSARHPMSVSKATMTDWGVHDQQAARDCAAAMFPDLPLWVIGHSLGGFMLPFQRGQGRIAGLITVASGPVHLDDHPWWYRPAARFLWSRTVRAIATMRGYLPGRALRLGADVPLGVYRQWRRWCVTHGGVTVDAGGAVPYPDWTAFDGQARIVAVADDPMVPPAAVWRLMQFYPEARKSQAVLHPASYGLSRIGHIGAFAKPSRAAWPDIVGPVFDT